MSKDPGLLGLDAIIIGRQMPTDHGKYIDLLAIDRTGGIVIIELKKDRTPREIVAQILDYRACPFGLALRITVSVKAICTTTSNARIIPPTFRDTDGQIGTIPDVLSADTLRWSRFHGQVCG